MIDYRYNEAQLIEEIKKYIDATYSQHYSQNKFQATEFIIDSGHGLGFTVGNVMKYAQRYGKKGGRNRQDILKVIHYAIMMLYVHDLETDAGAEEKDLTRETNPQTTTIKNPNKYSPYEPSMLEVARRQENVIPSWNSKEGAVETEKPSILENPHHPWLDHRAKVEKAYTQYWNRSDSDDHIVSDPINPFTTER